MTEQVLMAAFGASATAFALIALVFIRYYKEQRDRLFGFFAAAFGFMALGFVIRIVTDVDEHRAYVFLPRLCGFILIIIAIFDKNRRGRRS
jgi:hypothetical protein